MELDALNENVEAISKLGATQVLISPNTIAHNQSIAEENIWLATFSATPAIR